jgi:uncharacterized iron-regulated membrane protein
LSASVISYPWASNLVYRIAGESPPAPRAAARNPANNQPGQLDLTALNQGIAIAEQQVDGWKSVIVRIPSTTDESTMITIDRGDGGEPHKRSQLTLKKGTAEVIRWEPFSSFTPGRKMRTILRFAHTGEAAGIVGQTIAGLASAGAVFLVWTGLALALRRFRGWLGRKSSTEPVAAPQLVDSEAVNQTSRRFNEL